MKFQKLQIFLIRLLMIKTDHDLLLKNGLKFMINQEEKITTSTKKLELKHQCYEQIYVILVMHALLYYFEILLLQNQLMQKETKVLHLKPMHHLSTAFQKSVKYKLTMQKI